MNPLNISACNYIHAYVCTYNMYTIFLITHANKMYIRYIATYIHIANHYIRTLVLLFMYPYTGFIDREEQSLFTYKQNFSWETYHDPHFEPLFEPTFSDAALEQQAMETCGDDTFCLYDVATTGRMDIGLSTLDGSQNFDELVELSYPGNGII